MQRSICTALNLFGHSEALFLSKLFRSKWIDNPELYILVFCFDMCFPDYVAEKTDSEQIDHIIENYRIKSLDSVIDYVDTIIIGDASYQSSLEAHIRTKYRDKKVRIINPFRFKSYYRSNELIRDNYADRNSFSEDEFSFIFKHELTHFKRKDLLYKLIILIANGVHWFNPIIYLMNKEISYECEVSCDEEIMKSEPISRRKLYGEMILNTMLKNAKKKSVLLTSFFGGKKEIKRRLKNIIDIKIKKKGLIVFPVLMLIVVGVTLTFGINNTSSITARKTIEENNKDEEINPISKKTIVSKILESYPIETAMSNKDVIIITTEKKSDSNYRVCWGRVSLL
jgi:hypothetical protein